jgi:hypothetical protein
MFFFLVQRRKRGRVGLSRVDCPLVVWAKNSFVDRTSRAPFFESFVVAPGGHDDVGQRPLRPARALIGFSERLPTNPNDLGQDLLRVRVSARVLV